MKEVATAAKASIEVLDMLASLAGQTLTRT